MNPRVKSAALTLLTSWRGCPPDCEWCSLAVENALRSLTPAPILVSVLRRVLPLAHDTPWIIVRDYLLDGGEPSVQAPYTEELV